MGSREECKIAKEYFIDSMSHLVGGEEERDHIVGGEKGQDKRTCMEPKEQWVDVIVDSGATDNFCTESDRQMLQGKQPDQQTHHVVGLPSGETLKGKASFDAKQLPFGNLGSRYTCLEGMKGRSVLSIPAMTEDGCTTVLSKAGVRIFNDSGRQIAQGEYKNKLFTMRLPASKPMGASGQLRKLTSYQRAITLTSDSERVNFVHKVLGCRPAGAFETAVRKGYVKFPGLTRKMVVDNPPKNPATARGYMKMAGMNYGSSKELTLDELYRAKQVESTRTRNRIIQLYKERDSDQQWRNSFSAKQAYESYMQFDHVNESDSQGVTASSKEHVLSKLKKILDGHLVNDKSQQEVEEGENELHISHHLVHTVVADAAGKYPIQGYDGSNHVMIAGDSRTNYVAMRPYGTKAEFSQRVVEAVKWFTGHGSRFSTLKIDNELNKEATEFLKTKCLPIEHVQFAPPHCHRSNPAERKVQDAKNHMIAIANSVPDSFPHQGWSALCNQAEITHNLQTASPDPEVSSYKAMIGEDWNWDAHPMAVPGEEVEVRVPPELRQSTWAARSEPGWYVGPAEEHHRCYKVLDKATRKVRVVNSISFYARTETPTLTPLESVRMAAQYMTQSIELHASEMPDGAKKSLAAAKSIEEALNEDIQDDGVPRAVPELQAFDRDLAVMDPEAPRPWREQLDNRCKKKSSSSNSKSEKMSRGNSTFRG